MKNFFSFKRKDKSVSYRTYLIDFSKHPEFVSIDSYTSLKEAVDDFSHCGWEDNKEVVSQAVIIKGPDNRVEAVGMYVISDSSAMPVLCWLFSDGITERRFYETEYSRFIERG